LLWVGGETCCCHVLVAADGPAVRRQDDLVVGQVEVLGRRLDVGTGRVLQALNEVHQRKTQLRGPAVGRHQSFAREALSQAPVPGCRRGADKQFPSRVARMPSRAAASCERTAAPGDYWWLVSAWSVTPTGSNVRPACTAGRGARLAGHRRTPRRTRPSSATAAQHCARGAVGRAAQVPRVSTVAVSGAGPRRSGGNSVRDKATSQSRQLLGAHLTDGLRDRGWRRRATSSPASAPAAGRSGSSGSR